MRYCIWNNKGGVGKTFLTYAISTEYAKANPKTLVCVIDMCPQANVSEILLGGNGKGEDNLFKVYEEGRTISHYIDKRLKTPYDDGKRGDEVSFFIKPNQYNANIPDNLSLVAGSSDLDLFSKGIEFFANSERQANQRGTWKKVKSWLSLLLESQESNLDARYQKVVFFIDCNPSFSPYTELAFVAADSLIIPCTADGASVRALHNVFKVVYGVNANDNYIAQFSKDMKENNMRLPKVIAIVQNRNRNNIRYKSGKGNASNAFAGVRDNVEMVASKYYRDYPEFFKQKFHDNKAVDNIDVLEVKDCNALLPIISYNGEILSNLTVGKKYKVYKKQSIVSKTQLESIKNDINNLITVL